MLELIALKGMKFRELVATSVLLGCCCFSTARMLQSYDLHFQYYLIFLSHLCNPSLCPPPKSSYLSVMGREGRRVGVTGKKGNLAHPPQSMPLHLLTLIPMPSITLPQPIRIVNLLGELMTKLHSEIMKNPPFINILRCTL